MKLIVIEFIWMSIVASMRTDDIWDKMKQIDPVSTISAEDEGKGAWLHSNPLPTERAFKWTKVETAPIDECYCLAGEGHPDQCTTYEKMRMCQNKKNEAYAWGMTRSQDYIFWGTWANPQCLFADGHDFFKGNNCDGEGKDFRPPSVYMYSAKGGQDAVNIAKELAGVDFSRLNDTLGLRAAGNRNGVAIFAGPSKSFDAVYMFAFDVNGKFIKSVAYEGFIDVRKFSQDTNHKMYVGMSRQNAPGEVWRYHGNATNPFDFEKIATVPGSPAEISFYQDRLLIATWPMAGNFSFNSTDDIKNASLLVSTVPAAAMTWCVPSCSESAAWKVVWSIDDYEPDAITALSLGVGVPVELNGWVYFGTMQVPYGGASLFRAAFGPATTAVGYLLRVMGTHRPTSLFRVKDLTATPTVELLYGERELPTYDPKTNTWQLKANKMGQTPRFGRSGFGNFFNLYTWSMTAVDDFLLIGTFDNSYGTFHTVGFDNPVMSHLASAVPQEVKKDFIAVVKELQEKDAAAQQQDGALSDFGADLYVIPHNEQPASSGAIGPAEWISLSGLDNRLNFGFRNLVSDPWGSHKVYVGTANGYNLDKNGGWEVYELLCPSETQ